MRQTKVIAIFLLVIIAGVGWLKHTDLRLHAIFAEEQTRFFEDMEQRAHQSSGPKDVQDCIEAIQGYYPSGTKQLTGSRLDALVERARTGAITRLQAQAVEMKNEAQK